VSDIRAFSLGLSSSAAFAGRMGLRRGAGGSKFNSSVGVRQATVNLITGVIKPDVPVFTQKVSTARVPVGQLGGDADTSPNG